MNLIAEYIEAVHGMSEIQASGLDNRKKVKQNNQLADRVREISYISIHDKSINGLGNKMWLKQWFERYPADKDLL